MRPWSRLPTWWYRDDTRGLQRLHGGARAGQSQAALRVYLGACVIERPTDSFEVVASLSALERVTHLSRPMVSRGLALAADLGFIRVTRGGPTTASRIQLVCPEAEEGKAGGWAKLPNEEVANRLSRIPHRGIGGLTALKIYATLIAARPNDSAVVALRHVTLRDKTGAQPRDIRRGLNLLAIEGLVDVNTEDPAVRWGPEDERSRQAQRYRLAGRFETRRGDLRQPSPSAAVDLADVLS